MPDHISVTEISAEVQLQELLEKTTVSILHMSDLTKCQISDLSHLFVNGVLTVARGTVNISKNLHPLPLLMNICF